jgi:hypothetical protein
MVLQGGAIKDTVAKQKIVNGEIKVNNSTGKK